MQEIQRNIREQNFHPVYLLYGPENYLRAQFTQRLLQAMLPEGEQVNLTRFEGNKTEEADVLTQAETLPFFAERRVILVEDSGFFKAKTEDLPAYLDHVPDYLVLLFSEQEVDKRSRLFKAVQKLGHVAEFPVQSEDVLTRWVLSRLKQEGKKIRQEDMQHFLSGTGSDMTQIHNELEKLLTYCADKEVITGADIDAVCVPQMENRIFELVRAVTEQKQKQALELYHDLLAAKEPPMRILYLLARQFQQLFLIGTLRRSGSSPTEIASRVGMPAFAVRKSLGLMQNYTESRLEKILTDLAELEERVKTGRLQDTISVEMALVKWST